MTKRLIICSDGTWNTPDQKDGGVYRPSNVVKMSRAIKPIGDDQKVQVVFYDKGVGTAWGLDRLIGGAFGKGLSKNIEDAYRFLMHNYEDGDEIFLFGFSRGAYTVRSTAGLIRNCGLLKKTHAEQFENAYDIYRSNEIKPDSEEAEDFIKKFSRKVRVFFIGVWDTVGALGIPIRGISRILGSRDQFHDVQLSSQIKNAYHVLAIDEKRNPFKPTLWETKIVKDQKVEQVWFVGVHTNIGGGYKDTGLSDLAFEWMAEKAIACGLSLDENYINQVINPDYKGVLRNSKKGLYIFIPSHIRPIGKGENSFESVHGSAKKRYNKKYKNYSPKNLVEYFENN